MTTLNATEARTKLYALIDETATSHLICGDGFKSQGLSTD